MTSNDITKNVNETFKANDYDFVLFSQDPVIFTIIDHKLHVLMVKRSYEPYTGFWGLPGGRVDKHCENLQLALAEKLKSKAGLEGVYFEQVYTEGGREMDPRGWSVTTIYMALVNHSSIKFKENETGEDVDWQAVDSLDDLGPLAFWHRKLIDTTVTRLRDKLRYMDMAKHLMSKQFTIKELRETYEIILGRELSRQAFDKRVRKAGILKEVGLSEKVSHRPAAIFEYRDLTDTHVYSAELKLD